MRGKQRYLITHSTGPHTVSSLFKNLLLANETFLSIANSIEGCNQTAFQRLFLLIPQVPLNTKVE